MRLLVKILFGLLILALLYGGFVFVERQTRQELTRITEPSTQEAACLMWQPRLFRGEGVCALELRNSEGEIVDTVVLGTLSSGLEALQQFGNLGFQGADITVTSRLTGETAKRFQVREGRLHPAE